MKTLMTRLLGLLCYLTVITLLFDFNWTLLISPRPLLSVLIGMTILTASQYRKTISKVNLLAGLKWNLIFSSFLTTLMTILSFTAPGRSGAMDKWRLTESLLPMLYGSMIYLVLEMLFRESVQTGTDPSGTEAMEPGCIDSTIAEDTFRRMGLTTRECHVGLKLLGSSTNKEIAAELFISEATVKKHIQNIYQKLGATDRFSFRELYRQAAEEDEKVYRS
ncbi:MAG TPA: LuxR C-terminal-related transcriptional regulator [Negativicutes bacterium]|nr:LuxR C-terminal-related transcriptional regulator [Negativicutes bacterium]